MSIDHADLPRLLALAAGVAVLSALALLALLKSGLAHRLAIDEPNARSLHVVPKPRVGGLVLVPAALAGWLVASPALLPLAALAGGLSLLSYADDRHDLPVVLRFGAHLFAAGAAAWLLLAGAPWWVLAGSALAIGWLTNLYNFMDGADGMAGGMAVAGFGAYAVAALQAGDQAVGSAALMLASAAAGFLMLNFPPARVFMGDAGSIPLGFLAGALGLAGISRGLWAWWFPLVAFSPFFVDASVTLVRRAIRRERVWRAHREHAYQKLVRSGWSHRRLLLAVWPLMLLSAAAAVGLRESTRAFPGLLGLALVFVVLLLLVERRWSRSGAGEGR